MRGAQLVQIDDDTTALLFKTCLRIPQPSVEAVLQYIQHRI
jgi:hypothetical protein